MSERSIRPTIENNTDSFFDLDHTYRDSGNRAFRFPQEINYSQKFGLYGVKGTALYKPRENHDKDKLVVYFWNQQEEDDGKNNSEIGFQYYQDDYNDVSHTPHWFYKENRSTTSTTMDCQYRMSDGNNAEKAKWVLLSSNHTILGN
eukprot:jgi/Psemu1/41932/gm1.41932_g